MRKIWAYNEDKDIEEVYIVKNKEVEDMLAESLGEDGFNVEFYEELDNIYFLRETKQWSKKNEAKKQKKLNRWFKWLK